MAFPYYQNSSCDVHIPSASRLQRERLLRQHLEVQLSMIRGHILSTGNAMDLHVRMIFETIEQLRSDQEVLTCVLGASDVHHARVDEALVARIHPLVDLVDDSEWSTSQRLQSHQIEDGADGSLATRLSMRV